MTSSKVIFLAQQFAARERKKPRPVSNTLGDAQGVLSLIIWRKLWDSLLQSGMLSGSITCRNECGPSDNLSRTTTPMCSVSLSFWPKMQPGSFFRSDDFQPYDFAFTDSNQGIEILVGWKRGKFDQTLYTQRRELQAGNVRLRPGGLISILEKNSDVFTNLLFLHTDSGNDAEAYKNRQTMFGKIWSMKRTLEKLPEQKGQARLIAMGDLNTMGKKNGPIGAEEIVELDAQATKNGMRILQKTHDNTWSSDGKKMSNLDHIIASDDVQFRTLLAGPPPAQVLVDGWVNRTGEARTNFVKNISDHCLLFAEVT